jgi:hypothetical protein
MVEKLAKFGWTAEAIILIGPADKFFLVARETEAASPGLRAADLMVGENSRVPET